MTSPFPCACPLPAEARSVVCKALEPALLDMIAAALKAHVCHWNVRGPAFGPLHELFGQVYEALDGYADVLAERIAALGYQAPGSAPMVAKSSHAQPVMVTDGMEQVATLFECLTGISSRLRGTAAACRDFDAVTENMLLDMVAGVEKWGWKLAAHMQAKPVGETL